MKKGKINWCFIGTWSVIALFWFVIMLLVTGCASHKSLEHHYHHYAQADTLAIQAQVDKRMSGWHKQMDSSWRQTWQEYSASWSSHDGQKEHITENITTYIDSLGREVRQEQRTTDRFLSRLQQQTEQRLSHEFESRLSVVVDSLNDVWQQRLDILQSHFEKSDSASVTETPVAKPYLPWYKRWWQSLKAFLLLAVIVALLMTIRFWLPWCVNMFQKR